MTCKFCKREIFRNELCWVHTKYKHLSSVDRQQRPLPLFDENLIRQPRAMLQDDAMALALQILGKTFKNNQVELFMCLMQDKFNSKPISFTPDKYYPTKILAILDAEHWVCATNVPTNSKQTFVVTDTVSRYKVPEDLRYLMNMKKIKYAKIRKQTNGSACGFLTIFFIYLFLQNKKLPKKIPSDEAIRIWVIEGLKDKKFKQIKCKCKIKDNDNDDSSEASTDSESSSDSDTESEIL